MIQIKLNHVFCLSPVRPAKSGTCNGDFSLKRNPDKKQLKLLFIPPGTEMFHFPGYAPRSARNFQFLIYNFLSEKFRLYNFQIDTLKIYWKLKIVIWKFCAKHGLRGLRGGVSSFGHLRIKACLAAPRRLSQPCCVLHRHVKSRHPPYTLIFCFPFREDGLFF